MHDYYLILQIILRRNNPILLYSTMSKKQQKNAFMPDSQTCLDPTQFTKKQYFSELLILQNQLNQQLLLNVHLVDAYSNKKKTSKIKNASSEGSTDPSLQKNTEQKDNFKISFAEKPIQIQNTKKAKSRSRKKEDSEYQPEQSQSCQNIRYKLSETKNVPKNYGKAIMSFIKKFVKKTKKVLESLEIDQEKFFQYVEITKQKLNTIADLRSIWLEETSPYAKAFRILSMEYMRKHSFSHIFNSRVQNYGKHIKYRYKIINGLENPKQFTQIKDF